MKILLYLFILLPAIVFSQKNGDLSFNFEYNNHQIAMERMNSFLLDTNYFSPIVFNGNPEGTLEQGNSFGFSLSYQLTTVFDVGLYAKYQNANLHRTAYYFQDLDPWNPGQNILTHEGDFKFTTESYCFGVTSSVFLNSVMKLNQKDNKFLKNLLLVFNLKGGMGFANASGIYIYPTLPVITHGLIGHGYTAESFQGEISLRLGYKILSKKSLFTSLGINIGYQYFRTPDVKNAVGQNIGYIFSDINYSADLDYSGFFSGVYLTIGK